MVCRLRAAESSSSPVSKLFVPGLSLQGCKGHLFCVGKRLALLPSPADTRILSGEPRPILPRHATGSSYPHHSILGRRVLELLLPPRAFLGMGFRPPTRFLSGFLLFFSFLVFGLRHPPILTLLYLPPTHLPGWKTGILSSGRIHSGFDRLGSVHS